jgi:hypothetical protein
MNNQTEMFHKQEIEIFRKMSCPKKLELMFQLRETAKILTAAGLKLRHPKWSKKRIDAEVRNQFLHART